MAGFQILNENGQALTLNELDAQAAAFWGKEIDPKEYANPTPEFVNNNNLEGEELMRAKMKHAFNQMNNWKDAIGWYIAEYKGIPHPESMTWFDVIHAMIGNGLLNKFYNHETLEKTPLQESLNHIINNDDVKIENESFLGLYVTLIYYDKYISLIKHWQDKGYSPKRVS